MKLKKLSLGIISLLLAALACVGAPIFGTAAPTATPVVLVVTATPSPVVETAPPVVLDPAAEQQLYIDLYNRVNPAVVAIRVVDSAGDMALGSGFVIDAEGHIVTNNHVVEGATEIEVDFSSGLKVRGELLGTDPTADLAVIKVDVPADQLTVVLLGDSD